MTYPYHSTFTYFIKNITYSKYNNMKRKREEKQLQMLKICTTWNTAVSLHHYIRELV